MGNKSSSTKDSSHSGESRGRSRSFNGLASKFRRTSKSPPRDRSSSLSETSRPQRKGSGRQNGDIKPTQTSQSSRRGHDVPRLTPEKSAPVDMSMGSGEKVRQDLSSRLSQSAPGGRPPAPPTPVKRDIINQELESTQNTLGSDNNTFIKSSNLKNLRKCQISDKNELIENYTGSPRLGVSQMRQVSRELFSDQLEDLAKRRAMANLNRDLSLSNASLGLLSNRSKSMHSLNSCDYDYEERCNVGELLSFEHSYKVGELCRSITSQFSNEVEPGEESPLMRHRTNSASAIELGRHERKHVAMGATSVQMRRHLPSTPSNLPKVASNPTYSVPASQPEADNARRLLVSRALKADGSPTKSSLPSLSQVPPEPPLSNPRLSMPSLCQLSPAQSVNQRTNDKFSQPSLSQFSQESSVSPRTTPERSLAPRSTRSLSPTSQYRASSPLTNISAGNSPAKRMLINVNKEQLLAANMTKSMQKFVLESPGVGTNSTDYEKLHNKLEKKKKGVGGSVIASVIGNDGRERSSSFSILSNKTQQQQFVQQMVEEQQTEQRLKQQILHLHSHSYDSTPVSTGGDSGFRSRSQSWSSLSQKSVSGSKGQTPVQQNPMKSLLSYSVTSLSELPTQPQRYISQVQEEEFKPDTFNVNTGMYCSISVLQIRGDKRDNLGISFHITPSKLML